MIGPSCWSQIIGTLTRLHDSVSCCVEILVLFVLHRPYRGEASNQKWYRLEARRDLGQLISLPCWQYRRRYKPTKYKFGSRIASCLPGLSRRPEIPAGRLSRGAESDEPTSRIRSPEEQILLPSNSIIRGLGCFPTPR